MKYSEYIKLLQELIKEHSPSGEEGKTGNLIQEFFESRGIRTQRLHNNIIVKRQKYDAKAPLVVLNSHHDTVAIGDGWTKNPTGAEILDGRLYGRGSNDAGGCLTALIAAFSHFYSEDLPFNLMLIASGEEENFGPQGVSAVLNELDLKPDLAIIGEPTQCELSIAEKGLIVIDAKTTGKAGHAARDTGINALYLALEDIQWIKDFEWKRISPVLGKVKTTVTQISSGTQHNVIPSHCSYVIDCRVNEMYELEEILDILNLHTHANLSPRSLKWRPSRIELDHPLVHHAKELNIPLVGSPTLSDQVHFDCPSVKIGPGKSKRSHTADEFIKVSEVFEGIDKYIALLKGLNLDRS